MWKTHRLFQHDAHVATCKRKTTSNLLRLPAFVITPQKELPSCGRKKSGTKPRCQNLQVLTGNHVVYLFHIANILWSRRTQHPIVRNMNMYVSCTFMYCYLCAQLDRPSFESALQIEQIKSTLEASDWQLQGFDVGHLPKCSFRAISGGKDCPKLTFAAMGKSKQETLCMRTTCHPTKNKQFAWFLIFGCC